MTSTIKILSTSALCTLLAGTAFAQSTDTTAGASGEKSPDTVTCAEIIAMDTALIPGALYFITGYGEGHQASGASMSDAGAASAGSEAEQGSTDEMNGSSSAGGNAVAETMANGVEGDTTAATSGSTDTGAGTDQAESDASDAQSAAPAAEMADSIEPQSSSEATDGAMSQDASGAASNTQAEVVRITGLYEIPIEEVVTFCGESPDMTAMDAVRQHAAGSSETTTDEASGTTN
ncbi:hypothetical protein MLD63_08465 [Paracoccus sp. TK19116]|uniref:Secreted protein n=1 Tax=Paracoccus albicereus TaxID=2922394 RepID=A0ABT1MQ73_9RHOB|nr:hypothetical protein [Paracoccus albicereus]MCQ0970454.1 hypothetical protein [Paracoccus albicereus]